jgi:hypothetical protein
MKLTYTNRTLPTRIGMKVPYKDVRDGECFIYRPQHGSNLQKRVRNNHIFKAGNNTTHYITGDMYRSFITNAWPAIKDVLVTIVPEYKKGERVYEAYLQEQADI